MSEEFKIGDEVCYFEVVSYGEQLNAYKGMITDIMDDAYYVQGIRAGTWVKKGRVYRSMKECEEKMQSYLKYSEENKRNELALKLGRELITLFDIYRRATM